MFYGTGAVERIHPDVFIDGQPTAVLYAGPAPGLIDGVFQLNVRVPFAARRGDQVPVVIRAGEATSPVVPIAIR